MAVNLPQPPYKAKLQDAQGNISPEWTLWIRALFLRVGGLLASSNTELAALPDSLSARMDTAESNISTLTTTTNTHTTQINDLNQGPVL